MSIERGTHSERTRDEPPTPLLLTSQLLRDRGVRHGFSTRHGGVSAAPFATLNTAKNVGDEAENVRENIARVVRATASESGRLFCVSQVHGATVRRIVSGDDPERVLHEEADALFTAEAGVSLGIRTADCVPVLLHDAVSGAVAAVHAGWRGVAAGVIGSAVATLVQRVGSTHGIVAAIGPCIGPCCFEVGGEVVAAIENAVPVADAGLVHRQSSDAKPRVDLRRAVRLQLQSMGVVDMCIEDVPGCTCCDADRFFSYRRDGGRSGRHLAIIACP